MTPPDESSYETKVQNRGMDYYELIKSYISSLADLILNEMQSNPAKLSLQRR
jgi:hypothetical protein